MERISYFLRHGFDPTDCDNADNYFHPSDPLGPGPSFFGQQHQCHSRPLRPVPADPFEAFRFFNRLHGIKERECTERNAFAYLNRPRPVRRNHQSRKVKAETPDIIEMFHGDELPNLYFYNSFHEILKQRPFLKWFLGFEIVPGEIPANVITLPPSSITSRACKISELETCVRPPLESVAHISTIDCPLSACEDTSFIQEEAVNLEPVIVAEHLQTISSVSDVVLFSPKSEAEQGVSSDINVIARISCYVPRRLSTTERILLSMKGFYRLGVSLLKRDMEIVSHPYYGQSFVVTQYDMKIYPFILACCSL